jgi:multidrug efflux pump
MSISEPFIRRPVATTLLTLGILLAGAVAYRELPVSALPEVDYPTIVVATLLPGASADTMASSVTTPLERQLGQIPALAQMTSISSQGSSQITLQFDLDREIDAAEQDVQAAINAASNLLPPTLPGPPTYSKSNPADTPILTLALSSESLALSEVDDQVDSILSQKISQVPGVGLVTLNGRQKRAVRIQVDPVALAGSGLTLEDVRLAIVAANVNQPTGSIDGPRQQYTLATDDQLETAEAFEPILLAYKNGAPIRLREVAKSLDSVEDNKLAGWANDQRAIILNVQRQPGANVIAVADRVKALLPQVQAALPPGVNVRVLSDRTETVRASVEDVQFTLLLTIGLVVVVIYLFLGSLRATLIPSVVVPLSLIASFGVMWWAGFSLNNLSLMALTISAGFVVDDAIVMLENITRYIEAKHKPWDAALRGAKEIGFTIVSLTVSLVAVLIPLLFMQGLVGRIFREFASTLSAAIAISAVLSLTLTPMMAAHLLKPHDPSARPSWLVRQAERGFEGMLGVYRRSLSWVLEHPGATLFVTLLTAVLTAVLAIYIPKGLFPTQDTGLIVGVTEASPDVSFRRMADLQQRATAALSGDADVASVASFIGADGTNPTLHTGRLSIALKPRAERKGTLDQTLARLQDTISGQGELSIYLQPAQDLQIDSRLSRTQYQWTLEDANPEELLSWAPRILDELRKLPELSDVTSDSLDRGPVTRVVIDRDSASRLGVSAQVIDDTLYDAFGQRQVSTIFTQRNLYRTILEVSPALQADESALDKLYVRSNAGAPIPLSALAHFERTTAPLTINHQSQFRSVTLSFNIKPGVALGDAVSAIERARDRIDVPPGIRASFQGTALAFTEALESEFWLVLAALITVYIVLGVLYESFIHPITILSTLPSAGVGALLALWMCGEEFSVVALIGIVLLIGIVKKNAIMMIDFAIAAERDEGQKPREAIFQACLLRFRPIMMTTLAALLGGLPLALGTGVGSELRRPLGISIVGGLLLSQLLTLYTTPVIYLALDNLGRRLRRPAPQQAEAQ